MLLIDTTANVADSAKVNSNFTEVEIAIADLDVRVTNLGNQINGGGELIVVDDYPTVADAQAAARARNGELLFLAHEYLVNLEVQHRDVISGESRYSTVLKAPSGSNANVITGKDAIALFSTPTYNITDGANQVAIKNLTVDGNRANNTAGDGIAIWGYATNIQGVTIRNCKHTGLRTAWSDGSVSMEGTFRDVVIDTVGYHGWRFDGPHDSFAENIMVIDASQETDNGYTGIMINSGGNGRFINAHVWHRSTTTNRCYAAVQSAGSCEFVASHFEGCRTQQFRHNGSGDRLIGCLLYAPFGSNGRGLVVFNGSANQHIGCRYEIGSDVALNKNTYALQFGESVAASGNQIIDGYFSGFANYGPFNFYNSTGLNRIVGRGWCASGGVSTFAGTVNALDEIDYQQGGTAINYRKPYAYGTYASNAAAATGGVPVNGVYVLSGTNALTVRV